MTMYSLNIFTPFPILNQSIVPCPVLKCCFLTCMQISQETGNLVWNSNEGRKSSRKKHVSLLTCGIVGKHWWTAYKWVGKK